MIFGAFHRRGGIAEAMARQAIASAYGSRCVTGCLML
jgi:hypothetical protein